MPFWKPSYRSHSVARNGPTTAPTPSWIEMALAFIVIVDCTSRASTSCAGVSEESRCAAQEIDCLKLPRYNGGDLK
eukprot:5703978-Prymnesium_polylepis.1